MPKLWNPPNVAAPFGNYTQCSEVQAGERLLYISGQLCIMPDGTMAYGIEARAEQALRNIVAILDANDIGARKHRQAGDISYTCGLHQNVRRRASESAGRHKTAKHTARRSCAR
jgi:enamine deaminase RidA (YjgF/YER057c/UK114 family)